MDQVPVEKRFSVLCEITRAQHFAWREAVRECCPDTEIGAVIERMWRITGEQTARAYLKRLDPDRPLAPQVARSIAWSSQCMGEDAAVEIEGDQARVRHRACPWVDWHRKLGLLDEDRPGCDAWFESMTRLINRELGTRLRFETAASLPEGGDCCLRRLWVDEDE